MMLIVMSTAVADNATYSSNAQYRFVSKGNYRDMDRKRYASNIAIFDTIRYIVPYVMICANIDVDFLLKNY